MRTDPVAATVVRIGIVARGLGGTARAVHLGVTLDGVLDEVFARVPVPYRTPTWFRRPEGGTTTLVIPPGVPLPWVALEFTGLLAEALRRRNRHLNEFGRLRLRLAADHGDVVLRPPNLGGAAVALAVRLGEAEVAEGGDGRGTVAGPAADRLRPVPRGFSRRPGLPPDRRLRRRPARSRVAVDRSGYWDAEYRHGRWVGTGIADGKGPR